MPRWTIADIPDQSGRRAVITGAAGGLGYETALALAQAGATVVLTGRDADKAAQAMAQIRSICPAARIGFELLDMASLASVAAFAGRQDARIDILVNNAGVMALPRRRTTADRFERQFGLNHLGHFALTLRLLPLLHGGRVVTVSSILAQRGRIDFDDLQAERHYDPGAAYAQSKLANLMFARALQQRGAGVTSLAAHPGWARTALIANGPGAEGGMDLRHRLSAYAAPFLSQSSAAGALPLLYAATAPDAAPGGFYGPDGLFEMKGWPAPAKLPLRAQDRAAEALLWERSADLTGTA